MSLAVAIQMDPLEGVNIDADTTFALALEAQGRGHGLYHYLPRDLHYRNGRVLAKARPFEVRRGKGDHPPLGAPEQIDPPAMDVGLMRPDPPLHPPHISTTHPPHPIHPRTPVVHHPTPVP